MILTLTPDPARALVVVELGSPNTRPAVITRSAAGGPAVPLRNGSPMPDLATQLDDTEAPFGVPLTYTATDATGAVATATTRLDVGRPRLDHPGLAALGRWVRIVDDTPPAWESPTAVHAVIGRADPITVAQPLRTRAGTLTLAVADLAELDALLALCQSGLPLLLRTPCPGLYRDGWLAVERVTDAHQNPAAPQRAVELAYRQVARPQGPSQGTVPWTYRDVATRHGTYAELVGAYPDYARLAAGPVP